VKIKRIQNFINIVEITIIVNHIRTACDCMSEDKYIWLENLEDEKVKEWIAIQNEKTRKLLEKLSRLLLDRILNYYLIPRVVSVKCSKNKYYLLYQYENSFKIIALTKKGEKKEIIDSTKLGEEIIIKNFFIEENDKYLAYFMSKAGSDIGKMRIIRLDTGETIDELTGTLGDIVWLKNENYYYVKFFRDEKTPDGIDPPAERVFLRESASDTMVFGESLPTSYFINLKKSNWEDKALLSVSYGWTRSTVYGGDLYNPTDWHEIYGGDFVVSPIDYKDGYILLSYEGEGLGKILSLNDSDTKVIVNEGNYPLENAALYDNYIALIYLVNAASQIIITDLEGRKVKTITFEAPGSVNSIDSNGAEIVFKYQSFTIPYIVYTLQELIKKEILSKKLNLGFKVEEEWITSHDGTKIHMFKISKTPKPDKVLIYGYGGFGIPLKPSYIPYVIPFVEDGGTYVVANIRGGLEYGEKWHRDGMREKKQNVFNDFIAAIEYYKNKGAKVVAMGGSNGGLLVGAVLTQRPEILDGAVIGYPVLDMLRFHKLYIGEAWVPEYGNPDDPEDRKYLIKYSPYHNIKKRKYPPTLVYTGLHDDRVHPAHAFKFVAKMEEVNAPIYLRVETSSGHSGAMPITKAKEYADIMAFIYSILEMDSIK